MKVNIGKILTRRPEEANPSEAYVAIPGPAEVHKDPKASSQVNKAQVVRDLVDLLQKMPLTDEQATELYNAIRGRLRHATCTQCGKPRLRVMGELRPHASGDLTKPKQFWCELCI